MLKSLDSYNQLKYDITHFILVLFFIPEYLKNQNESAQIYNELHNAPKRKYPVPRGKIKIYKSINLKYKENKKNNMMEWLKGN